MARTSVDSSRRPNAHRGVNGPDKSIHRAEFVRLNAHYNMVRSRGSQDRTFLKESRLAGARRTLQQQRLILAAATPFFGGQLQRLQESASSRFRPTKYGSGPALLRSPARI